MKGEPAVVVFSTDGARHNQMDAQHTLLQASFSFGGERQSVPKREMSAGERVVERGRQDQGALSMATHPHDDERVVMIKVMVAV